MPTGVSAGVSVSIWAPSLLQGEVGEEGSELHRGGSPEGLSGVVHLGSRMPSCLAHCLSGSSHRKPATGGSHGALV